MQEESNKIVRLCDVRLKSQSVQNSVSPYCVPGPYWGAWDRGSSLVWGMQEAFLGRFKVDLMDEWDSQVAQW